MRTGGDESLAQRGGENSENRQNCFLEHWLLPSCLVCCRITSRQMKTTKNVLSHDRGPGIHRASISYSLHIHTHTYTQIHTHTHTLATGVGCSNSIDRWEKLHFLVVNQSLRAGEAVCLTLLSGTKLGAVRSTLTTVISQWMDWKNAAVNICWRTLSIRWKGTFTISLVFVLLLI